MSYERTRAGYVPALVLCQPKQADRLVALLTRRVDQKPQHMLGRVAINYYYRNQIQI